jgi:hypothetical protein
VDLTHVYNKYCFVLQEQRHLGDSLGNLARFAQSDLRILVAGNSVADCGYKENAVDALRCATLFKLFGSVQHSFSLLYV